MPTVGIVAVLRNPSNANAETQISGLQSAASSIGIELRFVSASTEREIGTAFAAPAEMRIRALMVASDPFFNGRRPQIVAEATRLAVPAIFHQREFVQEGGLMSYGTSSAKRDLQAAFSMARSRPTCPSSSPRKWSWSSI
jgi:putative ABC transport system substrate-binding protein